MAVVLPNCVRPVKVLGLIICDQVMDDRISGKKSLIGMFDALSVHSLPCVVNELFVFVALTNGLGHCNISVRCVNERDRVLFGTDTCVDFPDRKSVFEVNFGLIGCEFQELGEHRFQVFVEGELLCERSFHITKAPPDSDEDCEHEGNPTEELAPALVGSI